MSLPWDPKSTPLMLAPMQGLTNRALRQLYAETVRPDVLFTEFVRVRPGAKSPVAQSDFTEALATAADVPLIVQVIGSLEEGVVEATRALVERGVQHINVNMGCPFGRMNSVLAGGGMFRSPETVEPMLAQLRAIVPGSLSVKTRTGLDDERELFDILPSFERAGLDFLVVHARTVKQKYKGQANHELTRELIASTKLPVIANGDIRNPVKAAYVLEQTGAKGLMLGRGAIADPQLFRKIRASFAGGPASVEVDVKQRKRELAQHLSRLLSSYTEIFCGDTQVLAKFREPLAHFEEPELNRWGRKLCKARDVASVRALLSQAAAG